MVSWRTDYDNRLRWWVAEDAERKTIKRWYNSGCISRVETASWDWNGEIKKRDEVLLATTITLWLAGMKTKKLNWKNCTVGGVQLQTIIWQIGKIQTPLDLYLWSCIYAVAIAPAKNITENPAGQRELNLYQFILWPKNTINRSI